MKCNVGGFTIENIEDAHKFLKLMQEEDFNYYFNNFKLTNPKLEKAEDGSYYISMDDFYGDIEDDLEKIAAKCIEKNIHATFYISHFGNGDGDDGRYEFDGKTFESLNSDECAIRDALTIDLLNELKRRGINVTIRSENENEKEKE